MFNKHVIDVFEQLAQIYENIGDEYRAKAYRGAILSLSNLSYEITKNNLPNLKGDGKIPGIGKGILGNLTEILTTGECSELTKLKNSPEISAYEVFNKILGVGSSTIASWIKLKIYNINDLNAAVGAGKVALTHMQQLGLRYYDDLNKRIPRDEVTSIISEIKDCFKNSYEIIFTAAGSYRRGAPSSGDIDILITSKTYINNYLQHTHEKLKRLKGFIDMVSLGEQRYTFLYKSHSICRQIDLLYIDYMSYYAALCYFTGSDEFNRYMRGVAKSKNYLLNQKGLFKKTPKGKKLIVVKNEEELFAVVGIKWIPPNMRNHGPF
jgi:DNA polymerase/3'-5' exonuclease PolX